MRLPGFSYRKKVANIDGFTLIEAMIGLCVFSVGILGVMVIAVSAINGFTRSRISTVEVNRTAQNIEILKRVGYENNNIFSGSGSTSPVQGSAGGNMGYTDSDDVVVRGTKFIAMQNNKIKGAGQGNNFTLFFIKPFIIQ